MITKERLTIIITFIAVALIIGGIIFFTVPKESAPAQDINAPAENSEATPIETIATPSIDTVATPSSAIKTTPKNPTTKTPLPSPAATYQEALKTYAPGRMFQFANCHSTPGSMVMTTGTKFMLDNRDSVARTIAIEGNQSYSVSAYGFKIATAPAKAGTYYITCDKGGAASINVQK